MTARSPKAPKHLQAATRRWWTAVVGEYELEDHHIRLLTLAAEAFDRCVAARETIEAEGAYYTNRFGEPRAHPAVAVERDSKIQFARLLRELDLDGGPEPDPRIPRPAGR